MPITLMSESQFTQALRMRAALVVVQFSAPWCAPCKALHRAIPALEEEFPTVAFFNVNVEHLSALSEACGVTRVPTSLLFRPNAMSDAGVKPLTRVTGADLATLRAAVRQNL